MHISSFFIGCKGNDNRFFSVESCVNTCGGNEPETDAKCKDVTCDVSMATFMKAKGCVPKIKPRSKSFTSLIYADLSQDIKNRVSPSFSGNISLKELLRHWIRHLVIKFLRGNAICYCSALRYWYAYYEEMFHYKASANCKSCINNLPSMWSKWWGPKVNVVLLRGIVLYGKTKDLKGPMSAFGQMILALMEIFTPSVTKCLRPIKAVKWVVRVYQMAESCALHQCVSRYLSNLGQIVQTYTMILSSVALIKNVMLIWR